MQESCLAIFYIFVTLICISGYECEIGDMDTMRINANMKEVTRNPKFIAQIEVVVPSKYKDTHEGSFCIGSIIHWEWILTAAHCFPKLKPIKADDAPIPFNISYLSIMVGEKYAGAGKYVEPLEVHIHEKHEVWPYPQYDIAVVKTVPMKFTPEDSPTPIGAVTLNTIEFDKSDFDLVVRFFGWGTKKINEDPKYKALVYGDVHIHRFVECVENALKPVHEYELCTRPTKHSGPCGGDSGGPVMYNGVQVALVSRSIDFSGGCGFVPEIHTMVEPFQDWIFARVGLNLTTWRNQTNEGMDLFQHHLKAENLELPEN